MTIDAPGASHKKAAPAPAHALPTIGRKARCTNTAATAHNTLGSSLRATMGAPNNHTNGANT